MSNYDLLHRDIRRDISYIQKQYFPGEIKSVFFEILLPKTKPRVAGIICRSSSQNNFLETIDRNFPSIDTDVKETYILGDFKINMYGNNKYIVYGNNTVCTKFSFADAKNYQFCAMHTLERLIQCPNRVTCSTSTLTDFILASFRSRVSQKGVLNVDLSDHQLIFVHEKLLNLRQMMFTSTLTSIH